MNAKKKDGLKEPGMERQGVNVLSCQRCAGRMLPGESAWEEDGDGIVCQDCRAENESCGCSD